MAEQQNATQAAMSRNILPTQQAPTPGAAPAMQEKGVKKAPTAKRKAPAKKSKIVIARGKRKTAVARASARPGPG